MSSFKAKAAQVEKKKGTRSTKKVEQETPSTTETELALDEQTENIVTESVPESILTTDVAETTDELYGEENEQDKPKWERMIPLDRIRPNPHQPRKMFNPDKLNELADGMREHGWIGGGLPVRAHASEQNIYELVWGERRWRAAGLAGLKAIPCVVSVYADEDMIEKGLLENVQREDLTNLEEGLAYVNLLALRTEQGKPRYSIRRLAARIGKDKSYIEERLKYARVPLDLQQLATDQPDISPRIIHELGELAKILQPEERAPVIEGVRTGRLRIEDVREIRQDVEQQVKQEEPPPSNEKLNDQQPIAPPLSIVTTSVATDTLPSIKEPEEPSEVLDQEPTTAIEAPNPTVIDRQPEQSTPTPVTPMTSTVIVSVFEKTMKRDHEMLERIFQRLTMATEALSEPEQAVLLYYLKRWNMTIQGLIQQIEPTPAELAEEQ